MCKNQPRIPIVFLPAKLPPYSSHKERRPLPRGDDNGAAIASLTQALTIHPNPMAPPATSPSFLIGKYRNPYLPPQVDIVSYLGGGNEFGSRCHSFLIYIFLHPTARECIVP
jgi:hypothetical protein